MRISAIIRVDIQMGGIIMEQRLGTLIDELILYERENPRRINHALKVFSFAKAIGNLEGLDDRTQSILEAAAILHDIGTRESINKYNSSSSTFQEIEGPALAKKFLKRNDFDQELIDRVCYLVGHHHTYNRIDGIDYQILVEADMLVNIFEDSYSYDKINDVKVRYFKTKTGIKYLDNLFLLKL